MRTHHAATSITGTRTRVGTDPATGIGAANSPATDPRVDQTMVTDAQQLRRRALSLRARAASMDGPVCISYRRRASELMLEAWLLEIRSGLPFAQIPSAA